MQGAGGTDGGEWSFLIGLTMTIAGLYLLFQSISVQSSFGFGARLYGVGGVGVTSGMIMIPFIAGIGALFHNSRNPLGWVLAIGSLVALVAGVLANARFGLQSMSAFDLIVILVLAFGGIGLMLRSFRPRGR